MDDHVGLRPVAEEDLPFADNVAEQHALEKAGFTREGVIRGSAFIGGRYRDEVLYSVLREERHAEGPGQGGFGNTPPPSGVAL